MGMVSAVANNLFYSNCYLRGCVISLLCDLRSRLPTRVYLSVGDGLLKDLNPSAEST